MKPLKLLSLLLLVGMGVKGQDYKEGRWVMINIDDYQKMKDSINNQAIHVWTLNAMNDRLVKENDSLKAKLNVPGFCRLVIECDTVPGPKYKKINGRWIRIN